MNGLIVNSDGVTLRTRMETCLVCGDNCRDIIGILCCDCRAEARESVANHRFDYFLTCTLFGDIVYKWACSCNTRGLDSHDDEYECYRSWVDHVAAEIFNIHF